MRLCKIGCKFLKKSKAHTIICTAGVLFTTIVIVLMYNYYYISQKSFAQNLKDTWGDCDFIMTLQNEPYISEELEQKVAKLEDVESIDSGYCGCADFKIMSDNGLMLDVNEVYTAGVNDSDRNKARYQYSMDITDENIVVNQKMAESLQLEAGDKIQMGSLSLEIGEILREDTFTLSNKYMAIVSQKNMCTALGVENRPNYLLVKKVRRTDTKQLMEQIKALNPNVEILSIEQEIYYQKYIKGFRVFMTILLLIVITTGGLFIASVFDSFLRKYLHDMMIIKTIGGNQKQVIQIFMWIAGILTGMGCFFGSMISFFGGRLLFWGLAHTTNLSANEANIRVFETLILVLGIYIFLNLFLYRAIVKFVEKLPLQAVRERENNRGKSGAQRKHSDILEKIFRKDSYIAVRLLIPKLKENIILIATISMLTMFSYVSGNLLDLLEHNNAVYYRDVYLTECMVSNGDDQQMQYDDVKTIYETLKKEDANAFFVADVYSDGKYSLNWKNWEEEEWVPSTEIGVLDQMYQAGIIKVKKSDYSQCMILSEKMAKKIQAEIGHTYELVNEYTGKKIELEVVGIIKPWMYGDIIVDVHNREYPLAKMDSYDVDFFSDKKEEELAAVMQSLRFQFPKLVLGSYSGVMEQSKHIMKERFFMLQSVLYVLTILVGFGWLNAAGNMILSRQKEYMILRKLGMSEKRVQKMIWKQIIAFMMIGIFIGVISGVGIVTWLVYRETKKLNIQIGYDKIIMVTGFMMLLTALLRNRIVKASIAFRK